MEESNWENKKDDMTKKSVDGAGIYNKGGTDLCSL